MAAEWEVTSQVPTTILNGTGRPVSVVEVHFRTGAGHEGSVMVARGDYRPEKVRELIQAEADNIDTIGGLSSSSG